MTLKLYQSGGHASRGKASDRWTKDALAWLKQINMTTGWFDLRALAWGTASTRRAAPGCPQCKIGDIAKVRSATTPRPRVTPRTRAGTSGFALQDPRVVLKVRSALSAM